MGNSLLLQAFILIGAAQGFILAVHYFRAKPKGLAARLMALGLFALSFRLLMYPFRNLSDHSVWINLSSFSLISLLLVGPAIYLAIRHLINDRKQLSSASYLHFVPFVFYCAHLAYPYFELPTCYSYATLFSGIAYGGVALVSINNGLLYPGVAKKSLATLTHLNSFAFPLLFIPATILGLAQLDGRFLGMHPATFPYLLLTLMLYRLGYLYVRNSKRQVFHLATQPAQINNSDLDYLVSVVESQELFRDQQLTIAKLAAHANLSRHQVSKLINSGLGTSFNDFVNGYRIDLIKKRLVDPAYGYLSIQGIAEECGFKSKSTFHETFKAKTGLTPSSYRNSFAPKSSKLANPNS